MENKEIIDQLYFCAAQCTRCYDACNIEKNKENLKKCLMLDQDCADICRLTGQLYERNSESVDAFLNLCGKICERCAAECEKHADLEHCKKCADVCRKCAKMCQSHQPVTNI